MRLPATILVLVLAAGVARAEDDAIVWSGAAGVGAGFDGARPVSAAELRGDLAWDGGAAGLGARLRVVGDAVATDDWDEAADWVGLLRYLIVRNRAAREAARLDGDPEGWQAALAAGALGDVRAGTATVVDGHVAGAIADRRVTGVHARLARGDVGGEAIVGDLARGTMIAVSGGGPAGPIVVGGTAAIDPRAPRRAADMTIDTEALVALAIAAGVEGEGEAARGRVLLDLGWEPGLGAGLALVGDGALRLGDRARLSGRAEIGAGTRGYVAAPFGPTYLRLRESADRTMAATLLDRAHAGELGGVGGAASLAIDADDVGALAASARWRPGLGAELSARATAPAASAVQAAALVAWAPRVDALLVGAEARAELGRHLWSALELARQYRAGDTAGLYAERPVWQVTAWFGVAR